VGQALDLGFGEGVNVGAGFEGVEIAAWGAGAAGAKFVVKVGAAVGAAAHGPVLATGSLAAALVGVSRHDNGFQPSAFGRQPSAFSIQPSCIVLIIVYRNEEGQDEENDRNHNQTI
jgi:hypothetical protein